MKLQLTRIAAALAAAAICLPAVAKEAKGPVSGVSGAAPTKWDRVKGAFGGRKLL